MHYAAALLRRERRRRRRDARLRQLAEAQGLLSINQITAKALVVLHQKLNFIGALQRMMDAEDAFEARAARILRIRVPVQYRMGV